MSLRIACDLDGTVADMEGALRREAASLYPPEVDAGAAAHDAPAVKDADDDRSAAAEREAGPDEIGAAAAIRAQTALRRPDNEKARRVWAHVRGVENFWETLQEIEPGSVARLAGLAKAHSWEVLFLTRRPATRGQTAQVQTQRWLETHGFTLPAAYVMNGSRGKVAEALGLHVVVDDRPENCLDVVADSSARAVLVWRQRRDIVPLLPDRVEIVFSFGEALDLLEETTKSPAAASGLLRRVRSAIGL